MNQGSYLPPRLLQGLGVALLIGAAIFWGVTGEQSALFVGAALSLIGLGAYSGLHIELRQGTGHEPEPDEPKKAAPP